MRYRSSSTASGSLERRGNLLLLFTAFPNCQSNGQHSFVRRTRLVNCDQAVVLTFTGDLGSAIDSSNLLFRGQNRRNTVSILHSARAPEPQYRRSSGRCDASPGNRAANETAIGSGVGNTPTNPCPEACGTHEKIPAQRLTKTSQPSPAVTVLPEFERIRSAMPRSAARRARWTRLSNARNFSATWASVCPNNNCWSHQSIRHR